MGRYKIPEQCRLEMTAKDIETGKSLLQQDFIKDRPKWCKVCATLQWNSIEAGALGAGTHVEDEEESGDP